jgi:serine/threonine protein kinase
MCYGAIDPINIYVYLDTACLDIQPSRKTNTIDAQYYLLPPEFSLKTPNHRMGDVWSLGMILLQMVSLKNTTKLKELSKKTNFGDSIIEMLHENVSDLWI